MTAAAINVVGEFEYSPRVRQLFAHLMHAGSLPSQPGMLVAQAGTIAQGASVRLWLQEQQERVLTARYQAYGCPHFLAACESLASWLEGRSRAELDQWQWRVLEVELQMPASKRTRLLLLEDVLQQLRTDWDRTRSQALV
ncbi:MAG: iron-sulfur cluster assembly scaffold protein [Steroidobacteraceae bacterium]